MILSEFPIPIIFQFFSYVTLAGGHRVFEIALKFALSAFLYSLLISIFIFIFTSFRMHERARKPKAEEPEKKAQETQKTGQNKTVNVFVGVY